MKERMAEYNDSGYESLVGEMYSRHQSVQTAGFSGESYKPGLERMKEFDARLGCPSNGFRSIHVAGTNGKGSVCSMLASALSSAGLEVGLYTSPHLYDFRERIRLISNGTEMIPKEDVFSFLTEWLPYADEAQLSFFEITTGMAFWWFSRQKVDIAIIEVGLGGLLDSTNIITPELSVVTSIGLDHCALLGSTRAEIAAQKAGIFKQGVPAVVGIRDEETSPVFDGIAEDVGCPLTYASDGYPDLSGWMEGMDLKGDYQEINLRTVLCSLNQIGLQISPDLRRSIQNTAFRTGFKGRWETRKLEGGGLLITDIGHNPPALKMNFAQLQSLMDSGGRKDLFVIYGVMADKALDDIIPLMPGDGISWRVHYLFVTPSTPRALDSVEILKRFRAAGRQEEATAYGNVKDALQKALEAAGDSVGSSIDSGPVIYAGGSTFVVAEII